MMVPTKKISGVWRMWVLLALMPFALLVLIGIFVGVREWRAQSNIQDWKRQRAQFGLPVDNITIAKWYDQQTDPSTTAQWGQIFKILEWGQPRATEFYVEDFKLKELDSDTEWKNADSLGSYLEQMSPVKEILQEACKSKKAVRFPVVWSGAITPVPHLQQCHTVSQFVSMDFEYAFYMQDKARAIQDLHLLTAIPKAFRTNECYLSTMVMAALEMTRLECIQRSLTHSQWNTEELGELQTLLSDINVSRDDITKSAMSQAGILANALFTSESSEILADDAPYLPVFPSAKLELLRWQEGIARSIAKASPSQMRDSQFHYQQFEEHFAKTWDYNGIEIARYQLPQVVVITEAYVQAEEFRRLLRTAVACRIFKLKTERWPVELSELESVGLQREDYTNLDGSLFGYQVDSVANIWTINPRYGTAEGVVPDEETLKRSRTQRLVKLY